MSKQNEIIIFKDDGVQIDVYLSPSEETVWLSQSQMAELFDVDRSRITRHINKVYKDGELEKNSTCAENAHMGTLGVQQYKVNLYNLDMIISVGYRVNSKRGIQFRRWANEVLKDYMLKGIAIDEMKMNNYKKIVKLIPQIELATEGMDSSDVLGVINRYAKSLQILDDYDYKRLIKPSGNSNAYKLNYKETKQVINNLEFNSKSKLFGKEKDQSFKSSISTIYQTFQGKDLYPTIEEKGANLLYLIVKNHSFVDGNKRIAASIFLYFLHKNNQLIIDNKEIISNSTLAAITVMIALSKPEDKDDMVNLVMTFIS
ncbi:MAG: RhuM family protein [Candidatus Izemoplasmataceae bacterium]